MDDMMEKMQSLLSDPESMQQLQELAQMLQPDAEEQETGASSSSTDTAESTEESGGGFDFGTLMKVSQLMGSAEEDSDAALLLALKPHLRAERQKKVEKAVKMLKLLSVWTLLKESGMLKDFL
ncbi:MAG: hypothetical protein Q4D37_09100 [Oscillospiraceae bacterium]|nr:hypothetical protein [Oscillospiraceae bacterium]